MVIWAVNRNAAQTKGVRAVAAFGAPSDNRTMSPMTPPAGSTYACETPLALTVLRRDTMLQLDEVASEPANVGTDHRHLLAHICDGRAEGISTIARLWLRLRLRAPRMMRWNA